MLIIVVVISGALPELSPLCPQAVPTSRVDKEKPCFSFCPVDALHCVLPARHEITPWTGEKRRKGGWRSKEQAFWLSVCLLGTHCHCQLLTYVYLWLWFQIFWYPQMKSARNCAVWLWHEQHRPKIGDVRSIQNWIHLLAGVYSDFSGPKKVTDKFSSDRLCVRFSYEEKEQAAVGLLCVGLDWQRISLAVNCLAPFLSGLLWNQQEFWLEQWRPLCCSLVLVRSKHNSLPSRPEDQSRQYIVLW